MKVVDAHQHFWNLDRFRYDWMSPDNTVLYRNYLPQDLKPLMDAAAVDACVFVQATQDPAEAKWVLELAHTYPFIAGIVGWVDITATEVGATLDDLMRDPKFKGVRHLVQDEPDDQWMLRPDVNRGIAEIVKRGLAYDLLVFPRHLPFVPAFLEQHPQGRFVIDHLAKPPIKSGDIASWAEDMARIAAYPNVYGKLSGMVTEADTEHWSPDDLRPYVQTMLELFGAQRLMFGSDWPVCRLAAEYVEVKDALLTALSPIESDDLAAILGGTATEFYRL